MSDSGKRNFFEDLRAATIRYRTENRMRQNDLAKKLGIDGSVLSRFENGHTFLGESTLADLIELLRTPESVAARDFRNLADILESDSPQEAKRNRIEAVLGAFIRSMGWKVVVEDRTKGGNQIGIGQDNTP